MARGRPTRSVIRQNIIEILYVLGQGYGYDIAKVYNAIFPQVTQRSIYYHLRKGVSLGELEIHEIKEEKGNYSWGNVVEKIYYSLGSEAEPKGLRRVQNYFEEKGIKVTSWKKAKQTHKLKQKEAQPRSKKGFMKLVAKFRKEK